MRGSTTENDRRGDSSTSHHPSTRILRQPIPSSTCCRQHVARRQWLDHRPRRALSRFHHFMSRDKSIQRRWGAKNRMMR